jgi:transcription elongation GreA/GreB family factor
LRENHEYKAAKEQHRLLMLRKAELEQQLLRARGTDFTEIPEGTVAIGTRVQVTELGRQHVETFTILGAWDSDAEQHILGYLSPLAQSLMGKKVGDETELELDGQTARYRIDAISPYVVAKPARAPAPAPSTASEAPLAAGTVTSSADDGRASEPALTPHLSALSEVPPDATAHLAAEGEPDSAGGSARGAGDWTGAASSSGGGMS